MGECQCPGPDPEYLAKHRTFARPHRHPRRGGKRQPSDLRPGGGEEFRAGRSGCARRGKFTAKVGRGNLQRADEPGALKLYCRLTRRVKVAREPFPPSRCRRGARQAAQALPHHDPTKARRSSQNTLLRPYSTAPRQKVWRLFMTGSACENKGACGAFKKPKALSQSPFPHNLPLYK